MVSKSESYFQTPFSKYLARALKEPQCRSWMIMAMCIESRITVASEWWFALSPVLTSQSCHGVSLQLTWQITSNHQTWTLRQLTLLHVTTSPRFTAWHLWSSLQTVFKQFEGLPYVRTLRMRHLRNRKSLNLEFNEIWSYQMSAAPRLELETQTCSQDDPGSSNCGDMSKIWCFFKSQNQYGKLELLGQ